MRAIARRLLEGNAWIKLYGVARSRASRNIWLMKEAGLAFDLVPVM